MAVRRRRRRPRSRPVDDELEEIARDIVGPRELGPYVKILVYGTNGSGKTRFGATGPAPLFGAMERTFRSIQDTEAKLYPIDDWHRLARFYWALQGGKLPQYRTLVLDSVTVMYDLAMNLVLEEAEERDPEREKSRPTRDSYGRANKLVEGMLTSFRDLPMHLVLTAQEREIRDEDLTLIETTVELPNGARKAAFGAVDIIGHLEPITRNGKQIDVMRVSKTEEQRFNKDHTYNLGSRIKDPTMPRVIKAWRTKTGS